MRIVACLLAAWSSADRVRNRKETVDRRVGDLGLDREPQDIEFLHLQSNAAGLSASNQSKMISKSAMVSSRGSERQSIYPAHALALNSKALQGGEAHGVFAIIALMLSPAVAFNFLPQKSSSSQSGPTTGALHQALVDKLNLLRRRANDPTSLDLPTPPRDYIHLSSFPLGETSEPVRHLWESYVLGHGTDDIRDDKLFIPNISDDSGQRGCPFLHLHDIPQTAEDARLMHRAAKDCRHLTSQIKRMPNTRKLLHLFKRNSDSFDSIHLSTFWSVLGKMAHVDRYWQLTYARDAMELQKKTWHALKVCGAWSCVSIAHGMAVAGVRSQGGWSNIWTRLADIALKHVHQFKPHELTNMAWALVTARHESPSLFKVLALEGTRRMHEFDPEQLAILAWAFAKAGCDEPELFESLEIEAKRRINEFKPDDLASITWAFAKALSQAPDLFQALSCEATRHVHELSPQSLSMLSWAFAQAGYHAWYLFQGIVRTTVERVDEFSLQELSTVVWALATLGHDAPKLFDALARKVMRRGYDFTPRGLANTAWAFATTRHEVPGLFEKVAGEAAKRLQLFSPQNLANIAWAFGTTGHEAPVLFKALSSEAARRANWLNPHELCTIAWALAKAGQASDEFLEVLAWEVEQRKQEFRAQELGMIGWAFAMSGHEAPALFKVLGEEVAGFEFKL